MPPIQRIAIVRILFVFAASNSGKKRVFIAANTRKRPCVHSVCTRGRKDIRRNVIPGLIGNLKRIIDFWGFMLTFALKEANPEIAEFNS